MGDIGKYLVVRCATFVIINTSFDNSTNYNTSCGVCQMNSEVVNICHQSL